MDFFLYYALQLFNTKKLSAKSNYLVYYITLGRFFTSKKAISGHPVDAFAFKNFPTSLALHQLLVHTYTLDILFPSNHNIHKSSRGLCFRASDPLIERFC